MELMKKERFLDYRKIRVDQTGQETNYIQDRIRLRLKKNICGYRSL